MLVTGAARGIGRATAVRLAAAGWDVLAGVRRAEVSYDRSEAVVEYDPRKVTPEKIRDAIRSEEGDKYFFHFPDGNASIARMLVRKLIPGAISGSSSSDR